MIATLLAAISAALPVDDEAARPRLVVVLAVDQMRADFVDRFGPLFEHGLGKLLREGAVFENAALEHAFTETGPGHATLLTGRQPGNAGIVENDWYDRASGEKVYCVGDPEARGLPGGSSSSPRNLLVDALGDWMKAADARSKVWSVAGKDRAAVLMGGKRPDGVFWLSSDAEGLATSTHYAAALPIWVGAFNARRPFAAFGGKVWEATLGADLLRKTGCRPDAFESERLIGGSTFPHALPKAGRELARALSYTPYSDAVVLAFAREAIEREGLGEDAAPDLLAVGLSAADYIGHACGPGSVEVAEHFAALDRLLGEFLAFAEERAGKGRLLVALSSDHGVLELPEWLAREGVAARRVRDEAKRDMDGLAAALEQEFGAGHWIAFHDYRSIYLDEGKARGADLPLERLAEAIAAKARSFPWVGDAYTRADLLAPEPRDAFVRFYRNSFHPDRSGDVFLRHAENVLVTSYATGTSHGNPYECDRRVPLVLFGAGVPAGRRAEPVRTVDLAPSLAARIGIPRPEDLDGIAVEVPAAGRGSSK